MRTSSRSASERPSVGQVGRDDLLGHVAQPGVDQQRALLADEQVLAHVALAQIALDAVDARRDLHDGPDATGSPRLR